MGIKYIQTNTPPLSVTDSSGVPEKATALCVHSEEGNSQSQKTQYDGMKLNFRSKWCGFMDFLVFPRIWALQIAPVICELTE